MPYHRQPKSLVDCSLGSLCQLLERTCRRVDRLSQKYPIQRVFGHVKHIIRPYFVKALPAHIRSQLIDKFTSNLDKMKCSEAIIIYFRIFLLSHDIKKMKIKLCCYYGCSHQTALLNFLAAEGVGLESLELARSSLLTLDCKLLHKALLNMKNLQSLTLRNIANDSVLEAVGTSCPNLVILDIAFSKQVTDVGLKQLLFQFTIKDKIPDDSAKKTLSWSKLKSLIPKIKGFRREKKLNIVVQYYKCKNLVCDTLNVLNLTNTNVTATGVLLVMEHLPRLKSLVDYEKMGNVMEIMNKRVIRLKSSFNLTHIKDTSPTLERLELLAQACPRVESLHITKPQHPPDALRLFPHVNVLRVHEIPNEEWLDGFYEYLKTNGKNLEIFDIGLSTGSDQKLDLREIFRSCPNLRNLKTNVTSNFWSEGDDPPRLKNLKKAQLGFYVKADAIEKIFSLAPELQALDIHKCPNLSDEYIRRFLEADSRPRGMRESKWENSLVQNLHYFYIMDGDRVSTNMIYQMIMSCKNLRSIGNVSNWGLGVKGTRNLKKAIAMQNLDVTLHAASTIDGSDRKWFCFEGLEDYESVNSDSDYDSFPLNS